MTRRSAALLFSGVLAGSFRMAAQGNRKSPHETKSLALGDDKIEIAYGRPSLKGRPLSKMTQAGEVWRLGADEATKIVVSAPTELGSIKLAAGSYSLFAITGADKWTLIVNKTADQWGAFNYEKAQDLGRFDMPVEKAPPTEQFTIEMKKQGGNNATLTFTWGDQSASTTLKAG